MSFSKKLNEEETILHYFIDVLKSGKNSLVNYTRLFSTLCIYNN